MIFDNAAQHRLFCVVVNLGHIKVVQTAGASEHHSRQQFAVSVSSSVSWKSNPQPPTADRATRVAGSPARFAGVGGCVKRYPNQRTEMKPDRSCTGSRRGRHGRLAGLGALTVMTLALAACGGDDSSSVGASSLAQATASQQASAQQAAGQTPANQPYVDPVAYSMNATDGLAPGRCPRKPPSCITSGKRRHDCQLHDHHRPPDRAGRERQPGSVDVVCRVHRAEHERQAAPRHVRL